MYSANFSGQTENFCLDLFGYEGMIDPREAAIMASRIGYVSPEGTKILECVQMPDGEWRPKPGEIEKLARGEEDSD